MAGNYFGAFSEDLGMEAGKGWWDRTTDYVSDMYNAYNSWMPNMGANTANAAVTGIFSALSTLAGSLSARNVYKLYEQQEKFYIQNAEEQARRYKIKGDIALRNLEIAHLTAQGKNELGVAAAGGRLSGSFLDALVQNQKYNVMDERTSSLQTLWEVDNARRAGYVQAINAAGQAMSTAYKARNNAWAGLSSFIRGMSQGLLADKRQDIENNMRLDLLRQTGINDLTKLRTLYGIGANASVESYSSGQQQEGITSFLMNEQGMEQVNPVTGLSVQKPSAGEFQLIQLNEDGTLKTDYEPLRINNQ